MTARSVLIGASAALMGLGQSAPVSPQTGSDAVSAIGGRAAITPLVDHHQHLLGPAAMPSVEPLLARVNVPAALEALLAERARIYGNVRAPSDLDVFTEDAQIISWSDPSHWVRGPHPIKDVLSAVVTQPYVFQPNAYALEGTSGFVAGVVFAGPAPKQRAALDFLMALRKGSDGKWRIAAESTTIKSPPRYPAPIDAEKLVGDLDDAGIGKALVLSVAYWLNAGRFPDKADEMGREFAAVRAENDWVAAQVALYPDRLVMACSAHVLRKYVIEEMKRCAGMPHSRAFKLHLADADVDLRRPGHLAQVRKVFAAANALKVPLIVHFAPRFQYGSDYVDLFLTQVMPVAPDIGVQIAHLGGDGPGLDQPAGTAAFADAVAAGRKGTANLWFDVAGLVTRAMSVSEGRIMADHMRKIGLSRIVYASDGQPPNRPTQEHWTQIRRRLPLTDTELHTLALTVAPYMQHRQPLSASKQRQWAASLRTAAPTLTWPASGSLATPFRPTHRPSTG